MGKPNTLHGYIVYSVNMLRMCFKSRKHFNINIKQCIYDRISVENVL